jgi:putative endonuclease
MATHNDTGNWGEDKAADFLTAAGYEILVKNYRYQHAEIDLVARKGKMLIFVEVKTRSGIGFGMPEEFVNYTKAKLIMKAAENYIYSTDWHFDIRFDIISILLNPQGGFQIRHIEDAFC